MGRAGTVTRIQPALTCGGVGRGRPTGILGRGVSQLRTRGLRPGRPGAFSVTGLGSTGVLSNRWRDEVRISQTCVRLLLYRQLLPINVGEGYLLWGRDWHQIGFFGARVFKVVYSISRHSVRILSRHSVLSI